MTLSINCKKLFLKKAKMLRAPVAHAYNPSYSGGRDQEDHGSKPAQANNSPRPYLDKPFTKIGLMGVA
jgi:hypothetical protein